MFKDEDCSIEQFDEHIHVVLNKRLHILQGEFIFVSHIVPIKETLLVVAMLRPFLLLCRSSLYTCSGVEDIIEISVLSSSQTTWTGILSRRPNVLRG